MVLLLFVKPTFGIIFAATEKDVVMESGCIVQ